jgi:hypothetical protein
VALNFHFTIPGTAPCPCKSGLAFANCCDRSDGFLRPLTRTTRVPRPTGYSHPRCYAAGLGGCSTKISGEHPMSAGALELWAGGRTVELRGFTWMQDHELHAIPISRLASNILCKDHNSALSGLDTVGKRWVEHLAAVNADINAVARPRPETMFLINGHDLERWIVKMLCGLVVSGTVEVPGIADPRAWRPPVDWLEMVYGLRPLPLGCGLNFIGQPGEELRNRIEIGVISNSIDGPYGLPVTFYGLRFLFAMSTSRDGLLQNATYRPEIIHSTNSDIEDYTLLRWSVGATTGGLINIVAKTPEQ